jgi:hypothetical protein
VAEDQFGKELDLLLTLLVIYIYIYIIPQERFANPKISANHLLEDLANIGYIQQQQQKSALNGYFEPFKYCNS